jgi:hypothetical protein
MSNNLFVPQATAQFAEVLRNRALASRIVSRDLDGAPASLGDTLNVQFSVPQEPAAVTPGYQPTEPQYMAPARVPIPIDKMFERSMVLTDKELAQIEAGHAPQEMTQMAVDLAEKVNKDIYAAAVIGAGTVFGTAGTNPFATDEQPMLDALQFLAENKASAAGQYGVLNPAAYFKALKVSNFVQADRRGDAQNPLVSGDIGGAYGAQFAMDQLIPSQVTAAVGAGAMTINGVFAAGAKSISIAKASGASFVAKAGDAISIVGQPYPFVIAEAVTIAHNANTTITLTRGLDNATAGGESVTLAGSSSNATSKNSLVMHRDAVKFVSRPLNELTVAGINPADRYVFNDAATGLSIRAEIQRQHYQTKLSFSILYGCKTVRPELVARLLG